MQGVSIPLNKITVRKFTDWMDGSPFSTGVLVHPYPLILSY